MPRWDAACAAPSTQLSTSKRPVLENTAQAAAARASRGASATLQGMETDPGTPPGDDLAGAENGGGAEAPEASLEAELAAAIAALGGAEAVAEAFAEAEQGGLAEVAAAAWVTLPGRAFQPERAPELARRVEAIQVRSRSGPRG
jgi:hypothetical protein